MAFADCADVVDPSPADLAEIAIASAETTRRIIGAEPVVALLSFSTKSSSRHARVDKNHGGTAPRTRARSRTQR